MDIFRIAWFLRSGSHRVNFYKGKWETTSNIFFVFPFGQIAKEKLQNSVFMTFKKRGEKLE